MTNALVPLKVFPVIHLLDYAQAMSEVEVARDCGAHGVFLISHRGDEATVIRTATDARARYPEFPIGLNLLSRTAEEAVQAALAARVQMVWADRMGVDSNGLDEQGRKLSQLAKAHPELEFFASVAFKYQAPEPAPEQAARHALAAGFIPTTSGAGTGKAPQLQKIAQMSQAVGARLAVASGMTPENIAEFAPYLSHCLVATGVSLDEYHIDAEALMRFIGASRAVSRRVT